MATHISPALDDEVRRYVNDEITYEEYFRLVEERLAGERTNDDSLRRTGGVISREQAERTGNNIGQHGCVSR